MSDGMTMDESADPRLLDNTGIAGHPRGLMVLFFTEMWERFSFYGMRGILLLYLTTVITKGGMGLSDTKGAAILGAYTMSIYLAALPGGWVADRFLGYRKSVFIGGVLLAMGHLALAFSSNTFFFGGLVFIVVGTGMLKTSATTMVGQLYAQEDHRRDAGYSIYYMGINIGALLAPLVVGYMAQDPRFVALMAKFGVTVHNPWHWGFAAAGVAMILGLVQYLIQQHKLGDAGLKPAKTTREEIAAAEAESHLDDAHLRSRYLPISMGVFSLLGCAIVSIAALDLLPPIWSALGGLVLGAAFGFFNWDYVVLTSEERKRVGVIFILFLFAVFFWATFEQAASTLTLFADRLTDCTVLGYTFPSSWYQSVNSIWILLLAPPLSWLWVYLGKRDPSASSKFAIGLFCAGLGMLILVPALAFAGRAMGLPVMTTGSEAFQTAGIRTGPYWLVGTYFIHTIGELCLSPVGQSTTSRLAPAKFGGLMMGVWFLSLSFGNKLAAKTGGLFTTISPGKIMVSIFIITTLAAVILILLTPTIKKLLGKDN